MNDLEQTKRDYIRAKEILRRVSDADDNSIQTQLLREAWDTRALIGLRLFVEDCVDKGVNLTILNN